MWQGPRACANALAEAQVQRGELAPIRVNENTACSFTIPPRRKTSLVKSPAGSTHPDPLVISQ
jgi:hypothetical protein